MTLAEEYAILKRTNEIQGLKLALMTRAYNKLCLCPNHRDKASGHSCIVCDAERRTQQEVKDEMSFERFK